MPLSAERLPLTIIVPVHGRQALLERALASIAEQTRVPEKVVVVDDGSSPPITIDVVLRERLSIELVRHETNSGASAARNTGLGLVRTTWAGFLDSDDYLFRDSLERRWDLIARDQAANSDDKMIYACGWLDVTSGGEPLSLRWPRPAKSLQDYASGCWYSPGSSAIFNADAIKASGILQDVSLRRFEDFDWFLALALAGFSVKMLPVAAVAISRARVQSPIAVEFTAQHLLSKWRGAGLDRPLLRRVESYMALETAAAFYYAGSRGNAATRLATSLLLAPRLTLQLSPGWDRQAVQAVPDAVIER